MVKKWIKGLKKLDGRTWTPMKITFFHTRWCPSELNRFQLLRIYNSKVTMVYGRYIMIYWHTILVVYKPTFTSLGGHHLVKIHEGCPGTTTFNPRTERVGCGRLKRANACRFGWSHATGLQPTRWRQNSVCVYINHYGRYFIYGEW